jgi:AraC family transcriptional regulator
MGAQASGEVAVSGARWTDRSHPPQGAELLAGLGACAADWVVLQSAIQARYGLSGDLVYGGVKYGWQVHYRVAGRTLCDLYPEAGSFTVLVVLGGKERLQVVGGIDRFSTGLHSLISDTPLYHDGQWLWIHIPEVATVEDVLMLLAIKRRQRDSPS